MSRYLGEFNNQQDVENQFNCGSLVNCHILLASYELGDYCGDAFVLYVENGKIFEVNASHCSCYGLEGQFEPEETIFSALYHRVKNGNLNALMGGYGSDVLAELTELGFK